MLLIDGVRYLETPPKDEDELEQAVIEHAQEIFGENSIYLDLKHKIKSKSGVGSIPDGYAIILGKTPQWHVVEVELSSHPLHEHIVAQIGKFVSGIKNPNTQAEIVRAIDEEFSEDPILVARIKKAIGQIEIYKYLTDCISTAPTVTIIIEKATPELDDALDAINHQQKKVIEFRTFVREKAETVHVHLFEPLNRLYINTPSKNDSESKIITKKVGLLNLAIGDLYGGFELIDRRENLLLMKNPKTGNQGVYKIENNTLTLVLRAQPNEEKARKVFERGTVE